MNPVAPQSPSFLAHGYDFIVCGAGTSGSVIAGRLAANSAVRVLLLEAGESEDSEWVTDPNQWPKALGSKLDWSFVAEPNPRLNGRAIPYSMGKGPGGGAGINVGTWSRGHRVDWDTYADEAGDPGWNYDAVLGLYRNGIEDWTGASDHQYRGEGGMMRVQPSASLDAFSSAVLDGAESVGLSRFPDANGLLMEAAEGCAVIDEVLLEAKRQSSFDRYVRPLLGRSNLTVLTGALVTRLLFSGNRITGVEVTHKGQSQQVSADLEVIVCQGAIQTPKLLMQSGIGSERELSKFGISIKQELPGVGRGLHDHVVVSLLWEGSGATLPSETRSSTVTYWKTDESWDAPNAYTFAIGVPFLSPENAAEYPPPASAWTLFLGMRPLSRGSVHLTGANASDPLLINANYLANPADLENLKLGLTRAREIGNAPPLAPYSKREFVPRDLSGADLDRYLRNGLMTLWHQSSTAKMGRDSMSVVDGELRVYGTKGLRIADASVLPRVTTGPTMAPCVVIGERAAAMLQSEHSCK